MLSGCLLLCISSPMLPMERERRTKHFRLKSKKSDEPQVKQSNETLETNLFTQKDLYHLEISPLLEDAMKTPKRVCNRRADSKSNQAYESPKCRVGWDDGSDSNFPTSMESPVYMPSVERKLRRCPDDLYNRASKQILPRKQNILDNDCDDIQQCLSWAKNLPNLIDINARQSELQIKDNAVDILDDSSDELMVLCSQAVEESVVRCNDGTVGKRFITVDASQPKKRKLQELNSNATAVENSSVLSPAVDNRVNKVLHFEQKDVRTVDVEKIANNQKVNNNNRVNNFNYEKFEAKNSKEVQTKTQQISKKSDKLVNSMDLFASFQDDDDVFSSFDFNFIDNLQNLPSQNIAASTKSTPTCNPKPAVRYTKEQIEQRRLEAKKKLLFKKKNRSM